MSDELIYEWRINSGDIVPRTPSPSFLAAFLGAFLAAFLGAFLAAFLAALFERQKKNTLITDYNLQLHWT